MKHTLTLKMTAESQEDRDNMLRRFHAYRDYLQNLKLPETSLRFLLDMGGKDGEVLQTDATEPPPQED